MLVLFPYFTLVLTFCICESLRKICSCKQMQLRPLQKCISCYILQSVNWNWACLWFTLFKQWTLQVRCRGYAVWGEENKPDGTKLFLRMFSSALVKSIFLTTRGKGSRKGTCEYPERQPYIFISCARHYIRCDLFIIFMIKATRATLATEESKVERLKAQLKELLRFSQDVQPHAESVVSAIQQYQR